MAGISFTHKNDVLNLRLPPTQVEWEYAIKTTTTPTYAGEVVQVLNISFDKVVFEGRFGKEGVHGRNPVNGNLDIRPISEYTDWKNPSSKWGVGLTQMAEWFKTYFSSASQGKDTRTMTNYDQEPVIVQYEGAYGVPVDFNKTQQRWAVYPTSFPSFKRANDAFAPEWRVECEVYESPFPLKPGGSQYQEVFDEWRRGIGWVPVNKYSDPYAAKYDPNNRDKEIAKAIAEGDDMLQTIVDYYRGMVPALSPEAIEELILTGASLPNVYNLDGSNRNRNNRKDAEAAISGGIGGGQGAGGVAGTETDSAMMDRTNPPPSDTGANYGNGPAPLKFKGEFAGPNSDDRFDMSYTKNVGGGRWKDITGQPFDEKGRKV